MSFRLVNEGKDVDRAEAVRREDGWGEGDEHNSSSEVDGIDGGETGQV